jgi:hypothetical protein
VRLHRSARSVVSPIVNGCRVDLGCGDFQVATPDASEVGSAIQMAAVLIIGPIFEADAISGSTWSTSWSN